MNMLPTPKTKIDILRRECAQLKVQLSECQAELRLIKSSTSWRITKPARKMSTWVRVAQRKYLHLRYILRTEGLVTAASLIVSRVNYWFAFLKPALNYEKELLAIIRKHPGKEIIIFRPVVDWNIPLLQRPQHIAKNLAEQGFLYFYCTPNVYDSVNGFVELSNGCYLTDKFQLLMKIDHRKIIHIYAADTQCTWDFIEDNLTARNVILYEYIDEIHKDISGREVCPSLLDRHNKVMRSKEIICIASADKLYRDVEIYRNKNLFLVTNGVDVDHFSIAKIRENIPKEIKSIIDSKKPVIGYFGALAKWVDYELIIKLAKERPNYEILLIGWNYDRSIEKYPMANYPNIKVLGPINYKVLPQYACWFSVSIIPFRINDVTKSTSPVKLFEYMALGHPIVTSDMPECRKYRASLVAKSHDDFIRKVDLALMKREDSGYLDFLRKDSKSNSWVKKSQDISRILNRALKSE
jgi:teichuronic acid biosynthesis glycosyltransferase TuaH